MPMILHFFLPCKTNFISLFTVKYFYVGKSGANVSVFSLLSHFVLSVDRYFKNYYNLS